MLKALLKDVDTVQDLRLALSYAIEKECTRLWRLARQAADHGCSIHLINEMRAYPERLIDRSFEYNTKYAFRY